MKNGFYKQSGKQFDIVEGLRLNGTLPNDFVTKSFFKQHW